MQNLDYSATITLSVSKKRQVKSLHAKIFS